MLVKNRAYIKQGIIQPPCIREMANAELLSDPKDIAKFPKEKEPK